MGTEHNQLPIFTKLARWGKQTQWKWTGCQFWLQVSELKRSKRFRSPLSDSTSTTPRLPLIIAIGLSVILVGCWINHFLFLVISSNEIWECQPPSEDFKPGIPWETYENDDPQVPSQLNWIQTVGGWAWIGPWVILDVPQRSLWCSCHGEPVGMTILKNILFLWIYESTSFFKE